MVAVGAPRSRHGSHDPVRAPPIRRPRPWSSTPTPVPCCTIESGDEKVYPASLTKMMTLYMTFELIELGRLDYDSKIKMTAGGRRRRPLEAGPRARRGADGPQRHQGPGHQVGQRRRHRAGHAHRRHGDQLRPPDDEQGARHRHAEHHLPQRLGPARSRADDDGARHDHARVAPAGRLPAPLPAVLHAHLHLRRQELPQPQHAAGPLSRHRRHQDRLHARLRLQPRDVGAARRQARRRRGIRRRHGARAQRQDAVAAQRGASPRRRQRSRASRRSSPARRSRRVPQGRPCKSPRQRPRRAATAARRCAAVGA